MGPFASPFVTIVVISRNAETTIVPCITALFSQGTNKAAFEIILLDSGSTDYTIARCQALRREGFPLRVGTLEHTGTIGQAREAGAKLARGRYLAFVDADCIVNPGWYSALVEAITARPDASLYFGPRMPDDGYGLGAIVRRREGYRSRKLRYRDLTIFPSGCHRLFVAGSNMCIPTALALKIGVADRAFDGYTFEDVDLQLRLDAVARPTVFVPRMWQSHIHDLSFRDLLRKAYRSGCGYALLAHRHALPPEFSKWNPMAFQYRWQRHNQAPPLIFCATMAYDMVRLAAFLNMRRRLRLRSVMHAPDARTSVKAALSPDFGARSP